MFLHFLRSYILGYNIGITNDVTEERQTKVRALMSEESILNVKQGTSPTTRAIPRKDPERV